MKKQLLKFAAVLAIIGSAIMFSCEEPKPDCELYGYGDVTVKNSTGYKLWIDVTEGSSDYNDERVVYNYNSTRYSRINAGSIKLWASFDGYDWVYDSYYLDACEDLTYTWYLNKKKSTNNLYLEVSKDGKVIKTVTEFIVIHR